MMKDNETTAVQLYDLLVHHSPLSFGSGVDIYYCQVIRDVNKVKRLEWCTENREDNFEDVIFTENAPLKWRLTDGLPAEGKARHPGQSPNLSIL